MLASEAGGSRCRSPPAGGLERHESLSRNRRHLRRARSYQWQPPEVDGDTVGVEQNQRWADARAKAIAWAAAAANDPRVVYLDTETTGFGPRAEIVDIAVVSGAGEVLLESLVQPERRIPREVTAIHGITDADVRDAPAWCDLYDELTRVLAGRRIVVYNVTFDKQMVKQACGQYDLPVPEADWDCAMRKYAGFHGNWDPRKRWFSFVKLERAVLTFGAQPGGHRAAADAFACREVVLGMAATAPPDPTPALAAAPVVRRPWHLASEEEETLTALGTLARWSHAARAFRMLLEATPAELRERSGACGTWSVREVAAHAAGWEWEGARRLRRLAADPALPDAVYNTDAFNEANVAVRARQRWSETLDELVRASHTFGLAAAALSGDPRTRDWLAGRAADFEEHARGIRDWLDTVTESA